MAQKDFIRLDESDFEILLPSKLVKLGKTDLEIRALDLRDSNYFLACMRLEWPTLQADLNERGITEENFEDRLIDVAEIVMSRSPMLLSILTDLHPEDAARLPALKVVDVLEAVIEVNFRDRDFFTIVSTVRRVADRMIKALGTGDVAAGLERSPQSHSDSSKPGTRGGKSSATRGDSSARSTLRRSKASESNASPQ